MVTHSRSEIFIGKEQSISEPVHRGINILHI